MVPVFSPCAAARACCWTWVFFGWSCSCAAQAPETLAFDDVGSGNPTVTQFDVGPWRFTADQFHTVRLPSAGLVPLVDNGSPYIASVGGGLDFPIALRRADGLPFSLAGFDGAEAFLDDEAAQLEGFANAARIVVEAALADGGQANASFDLDGLKDGPGGVGDFQNLLLATDFANITSVTFSGLTASGEPSAAFALDNLVVTAAIPEPSALVLAAIAIGLAARGVWRSARGRSSMRQSPSRNERRILPRFPMP